MALEHIGQKLKTARDGLGLSLSQIHERTKIPFNHLQAIDNGQSDDLPEPVYVSGFIKRYAECVGLNGQQLVEEYKEEVEGAPDSNGRFGFLARGLKEQQPVSSSPPPNYFNRTRIEQPPPNFFKLMLFPSLIIVTVLVLVIFLASRQQSMEVAQDPSVLSLKDSASKFNNLPVPPPVTPEPAAPVATSTAAPASQPTPPTSNDARISLIGNRHVWVTVKGISSGEVKYTGFLETGDRRDFQDQEGLRVTAGSGGNLTVEVDGKSQTFGPPGRKTERAFLSKKAQAAATQDTEDKTTSDSTTSKTTASGSTATAPAKKPAVAKKTITARPPRRTDGLPSRQYMPGESLGSGTRAIDVPYRYSE